jgi:hypothetical protein
MQAWSCCRSARPSQTQLRVTKCPVITRRAWQKPLHYPRPESDRHNPRTLRHQQIMSNRVMEQDARLTNLEIKVSFTEDMVEELKVLRPCLR